MATSLIVPLRRTEASLPDPLSSAPMGAPSRKPSAQPCAPSCAQPVSASASGHDGASDAAVAGTVTSGPEKRQRGRRDLARDQVTRRLYQRAGSQRWYLDVRDLGGGREAMIREGERYATTDALIAFDLAAARIRQLLSGRRDEHFAGVTRTATIGAVAREWIAHKRAMAGVETVRGESASRLATTSAGSASKGPDEELAAGFTSLRTIRRYEQALTQLFSGLDEDRRADQIGVRDLTAALRRLRARPSRSGGTLTATSLHQMVVALKQVFDYAADEGVVPADFNPVRKLRKADRPRLPKQSRTAFLEVYEAHALLEVCGAVEANADYVPLRALVATYLLTGGRLQEVKGLLVEDVDFRRKTIRFVRNAWRRIKVGEERTVPLWPQLERELRVYLEAHPRTTGLLFPGYREGTHDEQPVTGSLHKPLRAAKALAAARLARELGPALGLRLERKAITPQVFRVTYCSARLQTLDGGRPISTWTVREELGHSSMRMILQVYGRSGEMRHRSAVVEYVPLTRAERDALAPGAEGPWDPAADGTAIGLSSATG